MLRLTDLELGFRMTNEIVHFCLPIIIELVFFFSTFRHKRYLNDLLIAYENKGLMYVQAKRKTKIPNVFFFFFEKVSELFQI